MIITIEGNIGSGKSTIINNLKDKYNVIEENVKDWKDWLSNFYKDKKKYSFGFQMQVLLSQMKLSEILKDNKNNINIIERSPYTSINIFGKLNSNVLNSTLTPSVLGHLEGLRKCLILYFAFNILLFRSNLSWVLVCRRFSIILCVCSYYIYTYVLH